MRSSFLLKSLPPISIVSCEVVFFDGLTMGTGDEVDLGRLLPNEPPGRNERPPPGRREMTGAASSF